MGKADICRELRYFLREDIVDFRVKESPPLIILKTDVPTGVSSIPKSDFTYKLEAVIKTKENGDTYFEAELFVDEESECEKIHIPFNGQAKSIGNNLKKSLENAIRDYLSDFDEI